MRIGTFNKLKCHMPLGVITSSTLVAATIQSNSRNDLQEGESISIDENNTSSNGNKKQEDRSDFPIMDNYPNRTRANFNDKVLPVENGLTRFSIPLTLSRSYPFKTNASRCESNTPNLNYFQRLTRSLSKIQDSRTLDLMSNNANKKESLSSIYTIHRNKVLGEGAFGSVYLATHKPSNEKVALKVIPKRFTSNETFSREMNALLKIRNASSGGHPNICLLREHFEEEGHFFLILDLVSGGEMFDHMIQIGAYSEADAARLVREVASALDFLHGIGVVHGDLKPENLMLSTDRPGDAVIKIVDFGCAYIEEAEDKLQKEVDTKERRQLRPLTPAYCPPEVFQMTKKQLQHLKLHQSMDMWSLGVILYIMLTGLHPFDIVGNTPDKQIALKIKRQEKPPLRNSPITAHLSESAIDLIEKLIQWDPKKRLTAHEMLQHPWIKGETARKDIMAHSDKKLSMFRVFKTQLEAKVFSDMVNFSQDIPLKTSLIEQSFRNFDLEEKGFLTTNDLQQLNEGSTSSSDDKGASLSLSGFTNMLSENMKNKYFQAGELVYNEGDEGNHMYFINSGTIEITTNDGTNTRRHRGDSFGEGALLHPKKIRSATVRCITPVHAIQISRKYFEKYLSADNSVSSKNGLTLLHLKEKDRTRKRNRAKAILRLQQNLQEMDIRNNELLFKPGQEGKLLFLLEQGSIDVQLDNMHVFSLKPGDLCGEHSLIMKRPRNIVCKCVDPLGCKVQVMNAKDFYDLLEASSESVRNSLRELCLRREFQKAVVKKTQKSFPTVTDKNGNINVIGLREAFDAVDEERKGELTLQNLEALIRQFDATMNEEEVKEVIDSLDLNENGSISFEEFLRIFGKDGAQADSI